MRIFFSSIDPFDADGQFADRGENYRTAVFTDDENEKKYFHQLTAAAEAKYGRKVCVELLPRSAFYAAEECHQDFGLKNPEKLAEEERISGRNDFAFIEVE